MEEFAIYADYQKACSYQEQQRKEHFNKVYTPEDHEGFKILFPFEEKQHEPENIDLPF